MGGWLHLSPAKNAGSSLEVSSVPLRLSSLKSKKNDSRCHWMQNCKCSIDIMFFLLNLRSIQFNLNDFNIFFSKKKYFLVHNYYLHVVEEKIGIFLLALHQYQYSELFFSRRLLKYFLEMATAIQPS